MLLFALLAALTGTVLGPDGAPVPDASVSAYRAESAMTAVTRIAAGGSNAPIASTTTDEHGAFRLEAGNGLVVLSASAEGLTPSRHLTPADEQSVSISLTKAKFIEGTVTADGKPVAGAIIVAANPYSIRELATTDAAGHFRVVQPEIAGAIAVLHRDFMPDTSYRLEPGVTVRGKVLDEHDAPVPNATVIADEVRVAATDDGGAFAIAHSRKNPRLRVVSDRGGAIVESHGGDVVIHVKALQNITGVVRDGAKNPIGGMPVLVYNRDESFDIAITDAKGAFTFLVPPGEHWISADGGEYFAATSVQPKPGVPVELIASRLVNVDGIVRDDAGHPVAAAQVAFEARSDRIEGMRPMGVTVRTAADGRFRLHVSAGAKGRFTAKKEALPDGTSEAMTIPAGGARGVVVTIPHGVEVSGVVTDGRGHPLAGVAVQRPAEGAFARLGFPTVDAWATTNDAGAFNVRMPAGAAALVFSKQGYVDSTQQFDVSPNMRPMAVALSMAATVRGRLVRKDGTAAGQQVVADSDMQTYAKSNDDGTFELNFPAPGTYTIRTEPNSRKHVVQAPSSDVRIVIDEGVLLRGRVVDAATGQPVDDFSVSAERGDDLLGVAEAVEDGSFVMAGLDAGPLTVAVTALHYLPAQVNAEAGQSEPVVIALEHGRTVRGRVHDPAGQALQGVVVRQTGNFSSDEGPGSAADGTFEIDALPTAEAISLSFAKNGYVGHDVRLPAAKTSEPLDVTLRRGLTVKGHVVDADGKAARDISINASTSAYGGSYHEATSDDAGAFTLDGLAPGRYDFTAGESASATTGSLRDVDVERVHEVTIRLERRPSGTIAGRVTGLTAASFVRMLDIKTGNGSMNGTINADGTFRVDAVPAGIVTVSASVAGMSGMRTTRATSVEVAAGGTTNVELAFEEQRTLRGRVTHGGRPVARATVSFNGSNYGSSSRATTSEEGSYELRLDAGRYAVSVEGLPYHGEVDVEHTSVFDIDFDGATARVLVVDGASGEPIGGALIEALMAGTHPQMRSTTGNDGRAAVEIPRAEKVTLIASRSGYANASADAIDGDVVMKLVRSAGAVVRIVDARDGRTLSGYAVARDASGRVIASTHDTEAEGTASLPVPPGEYRFSASADGYGSETVRAAVPSGEVRIALPRGGRLILRSNQELHGTARLLLPDGDQYVRCWCSGIADIEVNGRMTEVDAISPGSYTLEVTPAGGRARRYPVTVIQGESVPVQID